jgi:hypothetical protein
MADAIRLAVVGDIHHGPPTRTKRGDRALPLLDGFLAAVRRDKPDLVVDLGDRISDVDPQTDRRLMREVGEAFSGLGVPRVHLLGNHDMHFIDRAANEEALGGSLAHEVREIGPWRIVVFQPTVAIDRETGFNPIAEADLAWLADKLALSASPTLVLSHGPVSGHLMTGNYYFEGRHAFSTYPNADAVRAILDRTPAPLAWLSGHVHWNSLMQVDGIPHMTVQSLTESFTSGGEAAGAFSSLTLSADGIELAVAGADPFQLRLALPRPGPGRWPRRPADAYAAPGRPRT